jgi:excinuclease ABC subunit C
MENTKQHINNILSIIPEKPGCYQYLDENKKIIYIGKAKNLKRRISSYFNRNHDDLKTYNLIQNIRDIKYIITNNEEDALHLENNLIKQYQPKYNVVLKDDKQYPFIVIKNETFSRVFQTRNVIKDGSQYFGPYSSAKTVKALLSIIKKLYPIRNCKFPLSTKENSQSKYKVCLQYHIKKCKGPCEGFQSIEDYNNNIFQIKEILKGNISKVRKLIHDTMIEYSKELNFEKAQLYKKNYMLIQNYQSKSKVAIPILSNIDVFSFIDNNNSAYINYMHVGNGAVVQVYNIEYKKKLDESKEELLGLGIVEMRKRFNSTAKEIIVPFLPDIEASLSKVIFTIPKIGDKKKLLDLSENNVMQYKTDKLQEIKNSNSEQKYIQILTNMQKDLNLNTLPNHIECFDNSNLQGTNPVASCVVFKKGKPSKKDYRHFHIKTVIGANDFASMNEVIRRRYTRLIKEEKELPQLIVIDGGKGQLKAAVDVLRELEVLNKTNIIGLAKRLEEIYFPGDSSPLILYKTSETLKLIQHLRNEAHRFGITFHKQIRSKKQTHSELDNIAGIGNITKTLLLQHYKNIKQIKKAPFEELCKLIGETKANIITAKLINKDESDNTKS